MNNISSGFPVDSTTAVILAGGRGTRLRTVVADRQKVVAEVCGRPFLSFLLDQIATAGFRQVVFCTGYRAEQVQETFGQHYGELELNYSPETQPLDTAGAIRLALPLLRSETALVMNGDSFCAVDLTTFAQWHQEKHAKASIVITEVDNTSRHGQVEVDDGGRVLRFTEKGRESGRGWINAGIYLLSRELIETIPAGTAVSLERAMFPQWLNAGLFAFPCRARFLDIGTPESYALAEQFFAKAP